jgi:hypothetical protein
MIAYLGIWKHDFIRSCEATFDLRRMTVLMEV